MITPQGTLFPSSSPLFTACQSCTTLNSLQHPRHGCGAISSTQADTRLLLFLLLASLVLQSTVCNILVVALEQLR